jgi:glutamate-1-semialdehyde 2,1-aminomutase
MTRRKPSSDTTRGTLIVVGYLLIPIIQLVRTGSVSLTALASISSTVALQWFLFTLAVVFGRVILLVWEYDFRTSMLWFIKLITDPFTDIVAYYASIHRILLPAHGRKGEAA